MPAADPARLERALVPLIIFAVTAGVVSVVLDIVQDLSGFAAGVFPLAALGPAVGALAGTLGRRAALAELLPAPVARRQVVAHLILGLVASAVLLGIFFAGLAIAGVEWTAGGLGVNGVPLLVTILGLIVAVILIEWGIRGFAQPLLELAGNRLFACVVVGLIWGFWVVQMFAVENTALTVAAVVVAVTVLSILLGHLGNGSVSQRVAATSIVLSIVAIGLALVVGSGPIAESVALLWLLAVAITTAVFMAMFVAAQRKRARRAAA